MAQGSAQTNNIAANGTSIGGEPKSSLKILFLCDSFNSMAQRLYIECKGNNHSVKVIEVESTEEMVPIADSKDVDLIICPFLTKRVPACIYSNKSVPCWIVHPGIEGDRGMSSIDWALMDQEQEWGVTVLQAVEEMDAGPIWGTETFLVPGTIRGNISKSSLYRWSCIDAAASVVISAIKKFQQGTSALCIML